jgi:hypothetical protein
MALAYYLPAGVLLTLLASWAAGRHGGPPASGPIALALIGLSAGQVDFCAFFISAQILITRRDLGRAGSSAGQLTLSGEGLCDGRRLISWPQVLRVRVHRGRIPRIAVRWQDEPASVGERTSVWLPSLYGVSPNEMAAVFEQFVTVEDPGRALAPVYDDQAGTVTFFANLGNLRARRHQHLRSFWQVLAMNAPAAAGLFVAGQPLAAGLVLAVTATLLLRQYGKVAELAKPLRLGRNGYGRMLLSPEHLTLAGTGIAISWSHVHDAALSHTGRTGLDGVIRCPEHDADESCRYRDRTINFHVADSLFSTTVDDLGAAFGRYVGIADGA